MSFGRDNQTELVAILPFAARNSQRCDDLDQTTTLDIRSFGQGVSSLETQETWGPFARRTSRATGKWFQGRLAIATRRILDSSSQYFKA